MEWCVKARWEALQEGGQRELWLAKCSNKQDHAPESVGKVAIACVSELGVLAWACGAVGANDPLKMEMAVLPGSKWSVHQEHGGGVDELSGGGDQRTREGGSTSRVPLSFACTSNKSSAPKSNNFSALQKKQTLEHRQYLLNIISQLMFLVLDVEPQIVSEWSATEQ